METIDFPKEFSQHEFDAAVESLREAKLTHSELFTNIKVLAFYKVLLAEEEVGKSRRHLPADIAAADSEYHRGYLDAWNELDGLIDPVEPDINNLEEFEE